MSFSPMLACPHAMAVAPGTRDRATPAAWLQIVSLADQRQDTHRSHTTLVTGSDE